MGKGTGQRRKKEKAIDRKKSVLPDAAPWPLDVVPLKKFCVCCVLWRRGYGPRSCGMQPLLPLLLPPPHSSATHPGKGPGSFGSLLLYHLELGGEEERIVITWLL
jgi:hypothetical protein